MKKILQAIDGANAKPVEGANDMKKFLQVVTEGANPHKVALPVQMAMQHYQTTPIITEKKTHIKTGFRKFFREVEEQLTQEQLEAQSKKRQLLNQYAQTIAERVLMKESRQLNEFASEPSEQDYKRSAKDAAQEIDDAKHTSKDDDSERWNYKGDNSKIKNMISKARGQSTGVESDLEALVVNQADQNEINDRLADTVERQQDTIERQEKVQASAEQRFRELNAKVASGNITDQDVAAAQAAQEIEKNTDHEMSRANRGNDTKDIPEPELLKTTNTRTNLPEPRATVAPTATIAPATPTMQPAAEPKNYSSSALGQMAQQLTTAPKAAPDFDTLGQAVNNMVGKSQKTAKVVKTNVPTDNLRANQLAANQAASAIKQAKTPTSDLKSRLARSVPAADVDIPRSGVSGSIGSFMATTKPRPRRTATIEEIEQDALTMHDPFDRVPQDAHQRPTAAATNVDLNYTTIEKAMDELRPTAQITIENIPVTVYKSQMFAVIATTVNITNNKKLEHKKHQILGTMDGWVDFIESDQARHLINVSYPKWVAQWKQANKGPKNQATLIETYEHALNATAHQIGLDTWQEAKQILPADKFQKFLEYTTDQLTRSKVMASGPGLMPNENQENKKTLKNSNPCRKGYKPVGTKKKSGRTVPNCVPTNEDLKPIKPKKKTSVCKTGQVQTGMQTKDGKLVPKCSVTKK